MRRGLLLGAAAMLLVVVGALVSQGRPNAKRDWSTLGNHRRTEFHQRILPDFFEELPLFNGERSGAQIVDLSYVGAARAYSYAEGVFVANGNKHVAGRFRVVANYHGYAPEPVSLHADFDLDLAYVASGVSKRNTTDVGDLRLREDILNPAARTTRLWGYEGDLGAIEGGRRRLCVRMHWPVAAIRMSPCFDRGYEGTFWKEDWEAARVFLYSQVLDKHCALAVGMPIYNAPGSNTSDIEGTQGTILHDGAFAATFRASITKGTGASRTMNLIVDGDASLSGLLNSALVAYQKARAIENSDPANGLSLKLENDGKRLIIEYPLGMKLDGLIK